MGETRLIATYVRTIARKSREAGAPPALKIAQALALFVVRRVGPGYFLLARFWRNTVSFGDMLGHFNAKEYRRAVNKLNPPLFQKLSQHKLSEKALLSLRGIPTPRFLGYFHVERGGDTHGNPLRTDHELESFLRARIGQRLCFKKAEGSGGSAFSALDVEDQHGVLQLRNPVSGTCQSAADLAAHLRTFRSGAIIEAFLVQHPELARLNPDSVNTLRIITLRTAAGFETVGAMLRVGRRGSQVDNTSNGGLACPIDLRTGTIREALDLSDERRSHDHHPDSGAALIGLCIPYWNECMNLAGNALAAVPRMDFAGIDMAITAEGPSVIELNVDPDRRFAAHLDLPHRRLMGLSGRH